MNAARVARLLTSAAVLSAGCSPSEANPSATDAGEGEASPSTNSRPPVACDPLARPPTTLGTILGVGQDGQGTLYVVDQTGCSSGRVFVSDAAGLQREHVLGSGMRGDGVQGDSDTTISFEDTSDGGGTRAVLLQVRAGVLTAMALGPGGSRAFLGDPGADTQPLTVVDANAVAGLPVQGLAGDVFEAFDVSNGDALVFTAPAENCSDADLRLFYGPPGAVAERAITSFSESLSGATYASFSADGTIDALSVPILYTVPDSGPLGTLGPGVLQVGDAGSLTVTARPAMGIDGLSFLCFAAGVGGQGGDGGP